MQSANLSQAVVSATAATVPQKLSFKSSEHVSVADFGAVGGASTYYLAVSAQKGDQTITLAGSASVTVGEIIDGPGIRAGTLVSSRKVQVETKTSSLTLVGLSNPLIVGSKVGQRFDFAIQDDYPAFLRAQTSGAKYIEVPVGATREYYLSKYAGNVPGIVWKLNGAFFAQNGGVIEGVNQSMTQSVNSEALLDNMAASRGENTLLVTATNQSSKSRASYQKNAIHIQLNQGDPSSYSFLGDSQTVVRDIVGYSIQGHCPSGNTKCSMFGSEALMTMDPGSDGPTTGYEISIANLSGKSSPEMGSWNNKSALTLIGSGDLMGTAMWISGGAWQNGIDLSTSIHGKAWTIRTEGARGATGVTTTHTDYAYTDHTGKLFAQVAHVGGGPTVGDRDPAGGVLISSEASGRIAIGNSLLVNTQPSLEFHGGVGASADTYSTRFIQTSTGLELQTHGKASSSILHPDGSTEFGGPVTQTHAAGLVAARMPLIVSAHFNTITVCPSGSGVLLAATIPIGSDVYVLNRCGSSFAVSASPGVAIENSRAGASVTIEANITKHYYLESATQWRQLQ